MKKVLLISIVIFSMLTNLFANSYVLSGKISGKKEGLLGIILLTGDRNYHNKPLIISVDHDGSFRKSLPITNMTFAVVTFKNVERKILLVPGRPIQLSINNKDATNISILGIGLEENNIIQSIALDSVPFFMTGDWLTQKYARLSIDSLDSEVLIPVKNKMRQINDLIHSTLLPDSIKTLLVEDYNYFMQCYLYDFGSKNLNVAKNPAQASFVEKVLKLNTVPNKNIIAKSFYANMMLSNCLSYQVQQLGKDFKINPIQAKQHIADALHMPFDSISRKMELYGERYVLNWLYSKYNVQPSIQDKILFNSLQDATDDNNYTAARYIMDTFKFYCSASPYFQMADHLMDGMQVLLDRASADSKIVFHDDSVRSLMQLTSLYKGYVIYLDIWGTWCGPCRIEMQYVDALKKQFENKKIVFMYLSMNQEAKRYEWKEYVRLQGIEGQHFFLHEDQIEPIWDEVKKMGVNTHLYPTYLIFDRTGKAVSSHVYRPIDTEKLYDQLNMLLVHE